MKNVKPMAGQVWSIDESDFKISHINGGHDGSCVSVGFGWIGIDSFHSKFTFTEQGDAATSDNPIEIEFTARCNRNKETKMIDLSTAVVGDKFVANNGKVLSFFGRTEKNSILEMDGHAMVYFHTGEFDESVEEWETKSNWDIASKHDPRHWLGQLPDANLFDLDWLAVECEDSSIWHGYAKEPLMSNDGTFYNTNGMFSLVPIQGIKMPTLTGDEWKLSKIGIPDLKAWQKLNKEQAK